MVGAAVGKIVAGDGGEDRRERLAEAEAKQIIEESKTNFAEHFNKGWLEYRKSVTEAGDWAATEWTGSGAIFKDVLGREYLDCLGGYGMMDLGWCHPEVVEAVIAQVDITPVVGVVAIGALPGVMVVGAVVTGLAVGLATMIEVRPAPAIRAVAVRALPREMVCRSAVARLAVRPRRTRRARSGAQHHPTAVLRRSLL